MISLATRGYLYPFAALQYQCGPGPTVTDSRLLAPELAGAADITPRGPSLSGQGVAAPRIGGAASDAPPAPDAPPSIVGGGPLIPGVSSEEDED